MNNKRLKLVSPIPVSVNHYLKPRVFTVTKNGKKVPMVSMYETSDAKSYKNYFKKYVESEVKKQCWDFELNKSQHFYVDCVFYFDRIDKDANNYFKILLDAITDTQKVWVDDNVVLERVNRIYYDNKRPRIEIEIYPVDYIGIFDTKDDMIGFENKCKTCTRYKRNCSILNKAKEGRLQEEIEVSDGSYTCNKFKKIKG